MSAQLIDPFVVIYRGGIGKATAKTLSAHGCSIAVHYHANETAAKDLVNALNSSGGSGKAAAFQADLSNYDMVKRLHKEVVDKMGHPDILFNNAGITNKVIGPSGDIGDVSVEDFEATWRTNTGSSYLVNSIPYVTHEGSCSYSSRIADTAMRPAHGISKIRQGPLLLKVRRSPCVLLKPCSKVLIVWRLVRPLVFHQRVG